MTNDLKQGMATLSCAQLFAAPQTPEHALLNLPVLNHDCWWALAGRPGASLEVMDRAVRLLGSEWDNAARPGAHAPASYCADACHLLNAQPALPARLVKKAALYASEWAECAATTDMTAAFAGHPHATDDAIVKLLHPSLRRHAGRIRYGGMQTGPGVLSTLITLRHPVAAAVALSSADRGAERRSGVDPWTLLIRAAKVRDAASEEKISMCELVCVIFRLADTWTAGPDELLEVAVGVLA